ncbi:MAG: hypothetical protein J4F45_00230, partial [Pseudomonadales bacterium]|nr:hypothetical protein [Pseudomonadales bacterium]
EDIRDSSIYDRLQENSAEALEGYLRPVMSGLDPFPEAPVAPAISASAATVAAESREGRVLAQEVETLSASTSAPHVADEPEVGETAQDTPPSAGEPSQTEADEVPLDDNKTTSIPERLPQPGVAVGEYIGILQGIAEAELTEAARPTNRVGEWMARLQSLNKRQRAYGTPAALRQWAADRDIRPRDSPLPV